MSILNTPRLSVGKGDIVIITKISGSGKIQVGKPYVGQLKVDIQNGKELLFDAVNGADVLTNTSPLQGFMNLYHSVVIKTMNSMYVIEKV